MSVDAINPMLPQIPGIKGISENKASAPSNGTKEGSFAEVFQNAVQEVNNLQNEAEEQIEGLTLKKDGVTAHSAMVALEKADVAFQLMSAIRGKIIRAYEEVIRTQV
jgi:flagellar hook-basal body complex protein FliE